MDENLLRKLVESNPILYDKSHADYKNNSKKENVWEFISQALKINKDACKSRWTTMRQQYSKEKREYEEAMKSGTPGGKEKRRKFLNSLSFLGKHVQGRKLKSNNRCVPLSACSEAVVKSDYGLQAEISNEEEDLELSNSPEELYSPEYTSSANLDSPSTPTSDFRPIPLPQIIRERPREDPLMFTPRSTPSPMSAKRPRRSNNDVLDLDDAILNIERIAECGTNRSIENSNNYDLFAKYIASELKLFKSMENVDLAKQIMLKTIFKLKNNANVWKGNVEFNE